jgi:membrane protease YdiL (CAAX protease family)
MTETRQMKLPLAASVWGFVCLAGAFAGMWRGYGGRSFAVALATFAALFAVQVGLAVEGVTDRLSAWLESVRGMLPIAPFLVYLVYALAAGVFSWQLGGVALAYAIAPGALLLSAGKRGKGCWQDYAAALCIWLPAELHILQTAFPFPARGLAHPLWAAYAISSGLIAFLLIRRLDGIGYRVDWGRGWGFAVLGNFSWFAAVAIPLGLWIGFLRFGPTVERARALPLVALGILVFNAWPEEFLFRGLIQNLLSSTLRSDVAGLLFASVIFGLAHLNNGGFPNWRYALLAALAGLAYGSAWRKTRSIFASALVHAGVNTLWYAMFPTVGR